jgi:hypothetical protein
MTLSFVSEPASTTSPSVAQIAGMEVQPFVGHGLKDLSDDAVRSFERQCFANFQATQCKEEKGRWLHAMAAAIVELHRRGLSMNGDWQ